MSAATAKKCGHGCARCAAIEAGLDGKPLTPAEFTELYADSIVEPSRDGRVEWSPETREAELAAEVATIAFEDAQRRFIEVVQRADEATDAIRRQRPEERYRREQEIAAAVEAARGELEHAEDGVRRARRRYRQLAAADAEAHRVRGLRASIAEADEARGRRTKQRRRGALALLRR